MQEDTYVYIFIFGMQVNVIFLSLSLHSLYKSSSDPHKIRLQAAHQVKLVRYVIYIIAHMQLVIYMHNCM